MKNRYLICFALPAFAFATASADTIEMKDGTKYEGTVVTQEGDELVLEVQVGKSKGIKDEKRVKKADVAKITAEDKSESGFAEVAALVPVPDLSSEAEYNARLKKVQKFQADYKETKHKAELDKIVKTLTDELAVIKDGGVKFGGKIVTAQERKPVAYTLDSQLAAANIKKLAEQNNTVAALRAWSIFEKDFSGSDALRDLRPFVIRLMQAQLGIVNQMLADAPAQIKRRDEGLKSMSDAQRASSKSAIDEDTARYKSISEAEKSQQVRWPTLNPFVKGPIEETKRNLDSDIKRLQSPNTSSNPAKADEAYAAAWEAITKEGATKKDIDSALNQAKSAYVPPAYIAILVAAAPAAPAEK